MFCQVLYAVGAASAPVILGATGLKDAVLNNVVGLTVLGIFVAALVTAVLRARARDRCLNDFRRFHVTMDRKDGKRIWGVLRVYGTGFELIYRTPRQDPAGHIEASHIVYASQYDGLDALYRFHDQLTPENIERRRRSARRTYRPNLFRWLGRRIRNMLNTLRDALVQALGVVIGQVKKAGPGGAQAFAASDKQFVGVGSELVNAAANAFDPILERYVGKRIVFEMHTADGQREYPGILKDYTTDFLEVLNVRVRRRVTVPADGVDVEPAAGVSAQQDGGALVLTNGGAAPARVVQVTGEGWSREVDAVIAPGASWSAAPEGEGGPAGSAVVEITRAADLVVPRSVGVVRHAGPLVRVSWRAFVGLSAGDADDL